MGGTDGGGGCAGRGRVTLHPPGTAGVSPALEEEGRVTWRVVDNPAYTIGSPGVEVELDVPAGRTVDEVVKVEATYVGLSKGPEGAWA